MGNRDKIILDLCGGTGAWSKPYKDAGYEVWLCTLPECDVNGWYSFGELTRLIKAGKIYGILAAPPCTQFSFARTNAKTMRNFRSAMRTVQSCLEIIWEAQMRPVSNTAKITNLKFWALENPYRGFLKNFLGEPPYKFQPYEFGDEYQKETALWGKFNLPIKTHRKERELSKFDKLRTKDIHGEFYGKYTRTERRAITPAGFAKAFFEANQ